MRRRIVYLAVSVASGAFSSSACGGLAAQGGGSTDGGGKGTGEAEARPDSHAPEAGPHESGPVDSGGVDGDTCATGTVTLATKLNQLLSVTVDTSYVYWSDQFTGPVNEGTGVSAAKRVPLCGGKHETFLGSPGQGEFELATDATSLYAFQSWFAEGLAGNPSDAILKKPLAGGTVVTVARADPPAILGGFAANTKNVYWSTYTRTYPLKSVACSLMGAPLSGGSSFTVASWTDGMCTIASIPLAADDQYLYWVSTSAPFGAPPAGAPRSDVVATPLGGGATGILASGQTYPQSVVASAGNVYWIDSTSPPNGPAPWPGPGKVMTVPSAGGTPITLADVGTPCALAVDDTSVYWTDGSTALGQILKVPLGGGKPSTVVSPSTSSLSCPLAVDATSVYWGTYPSGSTAAKGVLMRSPK